MKRTIWLIGLMCVCWLCGAVGAAGSATPTVSPLDWRIGPTAWSFNRFTFFEALDKTAQLGLHYIEAFEGQRISPEIDRTLGPDLPEDILAQIRAKVGASKVRLVSIYIHNVPGEAKLCRAVFEFARKLGVETIVSEPAPEALDTIEKLCEEYRINLAIHNHVQGSSRYWHPKEVLKVCQGRSARIGACGDTGHWQRSGISPVEAVRMLGKRLLSLNFKDLNEWSPQGHDVPWGTGKGQIAEFLREMQHQGLNPTIIGIEYEYHWDNSMPEIAECVRFYRHVVKEIASEHEERTQI